MGLRAKTAKCVLNGTLFVILWMIIVLCLLNLINPPIPALRCDPVSGSIDEPAIAHVYKGDTVSTVKLATAVALIPLLQLMTTEWFFNGENPYASPSAVESSRMKRTLLRGSRWFRDYFFGLALVLLLNDVAKTTLNAPRPHWLDSCKPNYTKESCSQGWLNDYECSNENISRWRLADARKSFPSGHSALSFYAAWFMAIYQHRRISRRVMGTIFLIYCHLLWFGYALFTALTRISDKRHHPVDVAFGGLLGTVVGICSALFLCNGFKGPKQYLGYQSKINGNATILDGYPTNVNSNANATGAINMNLITAMNGSGPPRATNDKRHSLRRLLSSQSTMTDIVEDRELDSL